MPKHSDEVRKRYFSGRRYSEAATVERRRKNCDRWLANAIKKYASVFDYKKAKNQFETQKGPEVSITCMAHGHSFAITPDQHVQLKYGGCVYCKAEAIASARIREQETKFNQWFKENCFDRLEIQSEFKGMTKPMTFKCKTHNSEEDHKPTVLMSSSTHSWGCSTCARNATANARRLDTNQLFADLQPDLPEGITIFKIEFNDEASATRITLNCEIHGVQNPIGKTQFKNSREKCAECSRARLGYTDTRLQRLIDESKKGYPCSVAVMEIEALGLKALKVGVTTRSLEERYRENLVKVFYEVRPFEIDAYVLENRIKAKFFDDKDERVLKAGMRNGQRWAGDTELYFFRCKEPIIEYMKDFITDLKTTIIDYEKELESIIIPTRFPRSSNFEAGEFQGPIPVIGIDPETHEVLYRYSSFAEAEDMGFNNISAIVSTAYGRYQSKGVRWFKAEDFDPDNIPPLEIPNATPVFCIERNQHFLSTMDAQTKMRKLGFNVTGSKISAVLNGHRQKAGGFTWQSSDLSTEEIISQQSSDFISFIPSKSSNAPKQVRLTSVNDTKIQKIFSSQSEAARFLESSAGNLNRAMKNNGIVKGYKIELISPI